MPGCAGEKRGAARGENGVSLRRGLHGLRDENLTARARSCRGQCSVARRGARGGPGALCAVLRAGLCAVGVPASGGFSSGLLWFRETMCKRFFFR